MASDVSLLIADPRTGAVQVVRWLGGRQTAELARQVLAREPCTANVGYACWGRLTAEEATRIAEASYAGGADAHEVTRLAECYPSDGYWWMLEHDW